MRMLESKYLVIFLVLISPIVFTGCFDYKEEIWVKADGTAKSRAVIAIDKSAIAMMNLQKFPNTFSGASLKQRLEESENIHLDKFSEEENEAKRIYYVELSAKSLKNLIDSDPDDNTAQDFIIENVSEGMRFKRKLKLNQEQEKPKSKEDDGFDQFLKFAILQDLSNHYWTSTMHFDAGLVSANSPKKDSNSVTWQYPISRLMTETVTMSATFKNTASLRSIIHDFLDKL